MELMGSEYGLITNPPSNHHKQQGLLTLRSYVHYGNENAGNTETISHSRISEAFHFLIALGCNKSRRWGRTLHRFCC